MLSEGQPFPDFDLADQTGEHVRLQDLKGCPAIIYFYPKDDTPGCTAEACEFRDARAPEGARLLGVSPDSSKSHRAFADKFSLPFSLLADVDHKLAEACGIWVEKFMYGKTYMGVDRTTFLVDGEGVVQRVWSKVKPQGHAAEVLEALR